MAKKETIKTDDVFSSQPVINEVVNTTETIFKKSNKSDAELDKERLSEGRKISKNNRKKFTCSKVYAPLYPDGFISTYQGIVIELYFDGSTVELPEPVIEYVKQKIEEKAEKTADRLNRFHNPKGAQEKIGEYQVD
jgi:hypothetical protein